MNYIKSLYPWRWIFPFVMFLMIEYILLFIPQYFTIASIMNLITWIVVDITIGLGRREERVWFNIIGLVYLVSFALYLLHFINVI